RSNVLFGAVRLDDPSNRQFPSDALQELYTVPASGGRVVQLLTTPAEDVHLSPSGRYLVYHDRKGRENPWRKHQISSIARDIWLYDMQTGQHRKITSYDGEDRTPVFAGSDTAIFYLSEESGTFNIYSSSVRQPSPRQMTFFKNNPVRFLSVSRDQTLCFGYDGDIYSKKMNAPPSKVRITIDEPDTKDEVLIPVGEGVKEMTAAPNGKEIAFVFRGDIFLRRTDDSLVRPLTQTPGEEAGPCWSPDSRHLIYAAERDNHWKIIEVRPGSDNRESVLIGNEQENYQPQFSPDGKEIAYIENRNTLKIFNLTSRDSRTILASDKLYSRRDNDQSFQWSPDGKWLLLQFNEQGAGNDEIGIVRTDGKGTLINLTNSGFNDGHPKWAMDGKAIVWLSDRNGLRSYSGSGVRQNNVYVLFLTPESRNDFRKQDNTLKTTTVAVEGLPRVMRARLSASSGRLGDFLLSSGGQYLYTLSGSGKGYDLWQTDLHSRES
ncbi:MAG TPA: hypothetical protein VN824_18385, partial [Puia sp.]|nr:hypothetical protein [Puia sp.]